MNGIKSEVWNYLFLPITQTEKLKQILLSANIQSSLWQGGVEDMRPVPSLHVMGAVGLWQASLQGRWRWGPAINPQSQPVTERSGETGHSGWRKSVVRNLMGLPRTHTSFHSLLPSHCPVWSMTIPFRCKLAFPLLDLGCLTQLQLGPTWQYFRSFNAILPFPI